MYKKFGRYFVARGSELGISINRPAYYEYIVTDEFGEVMGHYRDEKMAETLAKGLEKNDLAQLNEEIENILLIND